LSSVLAHTAQGVAYPEHRQLSLLAVQRLDAERKAVFDRLWQDARAGDEQRLCAGAVGGSALANDAEQYQADLLRHFPGATCTSGDGGAVNSLRPAVRRAWLAQTPLPREPRYYSLVTFPRPERISSILKSSYDKLARIDARNDSQMIFYDQVRRCCALWKRTWRK
jgi:hypothetical protein